MAFQAATATVRTVVTVAPILIPIVVTLCYGWLCWMRPFKRCRTCHGHGQTTTWLLHRRRTCRRCGGEGWRLRHGRRAYNHLRRLQQAAHITATSGTTISSAPRKARRS